MLKLAIIFIVSLFALSARSQLAIIRDADGYSNVREKSTTKCKIVGILYRDDIFTYNFDNDGDEWAAVYCTRSGKPDVQGYLHRSRLLPIDSMKTISRSLANRVEKANQLCVQNDSVDVAVSIKPFSSKNHKIEKDSSGYVIKIDGREPKGTDGNLPSWKLDKISLRLRGTEIVIPGSAYNDLFEPGIQSFNVYFDQKGRIFLYMQLNSDGAGGYFVAWMVKDGKYVKRYVDSM